MTGEGYNLLIDHEGEVLHAYQDSLGFWSIGVGHLLDQRKGGGITQHFSRMLLDDDIAQAQVDAHRAFPWFATLDPVRQDVITMLVFNLGIGGLLQFKRMAAAIERKDWAGAAWELSNSQWKTQVGKERHDCLTGALEHGAWNKAVV